MKIIELSGKMGAGKDYIADKLTSKLKEKDMKVERLAFADPLRKELNDIVLWVKCCESTKSIARKMNVSVAEIQHVIDIFDSEPTFSQPDFAMENRPAVYRELLQYWGTDVRRARDRNYWVDKIIETIMDNKDFFDVFLITDARFGNEIIRLKQFKGLYSVRLRATESLREQRVENRDNVIPTLNELVHTSETSINDLDEDMMTIFNSIKYSNGDNGSIIADEIITESKILQ